MVLIGRSRCLARRVSRAGIVILAGFAGVGSAETDPRARDVYAGYGERSIRQVHPEPAEPASAADPVIAATAQLAAEQAMPDRAPRAAPASVQTAGSANADRPRQASQASPPRELIGRTLVDPQGKEIGRISDIVRRKQDKSLQAVVSSGGFLGLGEKKRVVPLDQVDVEQEGARIKPAIGPRPPERLAHFDQNGYEAVEPATGSRSLQVSRAPSTEARPALE